MIKLNTLASVANISLVMQFVPYKHIYTFCEGSHSPCSDFDQVAVYIPEPVARSNLKVIKILLSISSM